MLWGLVTQVHVLKVGVPDVGLKPFTPQGEAQVCEFVTHMVVGCQAGDGIYGDIMSQPLLATWGFLVCSMYASCSASSGFFRRNCSICSSPLVSMGGSGFRIFPHLHLELEPALQVCGWTGSTREREGAAVGECTFCDKLPLGGGVSVPSFGLGAWPNMGK